MLLTVEQVSYISICAHKVYRAALTQLCSSLEWCPLTLLCDTFASREDQNQPVGCSHNIKMKAIKIKFEVVKMDCLANVDILWLSPEDQVRVSPDSRLLS